MAQQTDGYLKLYTYKTTDTDTQFREFREQIAGSHVGDIESNFEKIDTVYTSEINNQVVALTTVETAVGNVFSATLTGKYTIKNNTKLTVKFPSVIPATLASKNNVSVKYTDIESNVEKTVVGTLSVIDRNGVLGNVSLSNILPNNIYTIIYNTKATDNYFIIETLKTSITGLETVATNNILAKATDYSFKDTGIPYTDVLTKPMLTDYIDDTLIVKNSVDGQPTISGTSINQNNVYLCDGTRDLTNPTIIKKIDLLSPTNRNRLNLRWNDSEGSILGYIGAKTNETQFLSISNTNKCVDKLILRSNDSVNIQSPITVNLSINPSFADSVALMPESRAILTPYGLFVFLRIQRKASTNISNQPIIKIQQDISLKLQVTEDALCGFINNNTAFGQIRGTIFDFKHPEDDPTFLYLYPRGNLGEAVYLWGFGCIPLKTSN